MKKILLFGSLIITLLSCKNTDATENISSEPTPNSSVSSEETIEYTDEMYAQDWEVFKQAVITKDKDAVLFYAVKHDQSLRDILDLSYDYIFDDQMIENIENMNYSDLPISSENEKWKELSTFYYGEVEGELNESGTFLYFEERPEGLRIVNFLAAG